MAVECTQFTGPGAIRPDRLEANEKIQKTWNMEVVEDGLVKPAGTGTYRLSFYFGSTEDSYTQEIVHSNEFSIR